MEHPMRQARSILVLAAGCISLLAGGGWAAVDGGEFREGEDFIRGEFCGGGWVRDGGDRGEALPAYFFRSHEEVEDASDAREEEDGPEPCEGGVG
jgi:hypothetical protein